MPEHSPTPWKRGEEHEYACKIHDANGKLVGDIKQELTGIWSGGKLDNARRILACVNVLSDVPTEVLEDLIAGLATEVRWGKNRLQSNKRTGEPDV